MSPNRKMRLREKERISVAVIGGSGLYEMDGMEEVREVRVKTPFGDPSDAIVCGTLGGVRVGFLPRHGRGHRILPTELNQRANIWALKYLGAERCLGVSACGSLREDYRPRDFAIPDQLYDRTKHRVSTFFGEGVVGHVSVADPYCGPLSEQVYRACREEGIPVHKGGTYVCIEGPSFSTKAESEVYRKMGFSIIGMTNIPEAKLAREAELCYCCIGLVTDYDVWHESGTVTVEAVVENVAANVANVKRMLRRLIPTLVGPRNCPCPNALKNAIQTDPRHFRPATKKKLWLFLEKYYQKEAK